MPQGFRYQGVPIVSMLSPTTGPTLGGAPPVRLSGGGRHTLGGLAGGPHYRCRFGNGTGGGYGAHGVHGMYGAYLDVPATHGHEDNTYGLQVLSRALALALTLALGVALALTLALTLTLTLPLPYP